MNVYLPEIPREAPGRNSHALRVLESKAENLLPDLQRIDEPLTALVAALAGERTAQEKRVSAEIHALGHQMAMGVRDDLGALADAARQAKTRLGELAAARQAAGGPARPGDLATRMNVLIDHLIDGLEALDLRAVAQMKAGELPEDVAASFHKLWAWVLEVYFGASLSKYHWPEFARKALRRDGGKELKRRMIIHNYSQLSSSERLELSELNSLHAPFLRGKLANAQLSRLLDCLRAVGEYVELYAQYCAGKKSGSDSEEARLMREEERKYTEQALQLSSRMYERVTAVEALAGWLEEAFAPAN